MVRRRSQPSTLWLLSFVALACGRVTPGPGANADEVTLCNTDATCGAGRTCTNGACVPESSGSSSGGGTPSGTNDSGSAGTASAANGGTSSAGSGATSASPSGGSPSNVGAGTAGSAVGGQAVGGQGSGGRSAEGGTGGASEQAGSGGGAGTPSEGGAATLPMVDGGTLECDAEDDTDACHPERCDELSEACCDPAPNEGERYCTGDVACQHVCGADSGCINYRCVNPLQLCVPGCEISPTTGCDDEDPGSTTWACPEIVEGGWERLQDDCRDLGTQVPRVCCPSDFNPCE